MGWPFSGYNKIIIITTFLHNGFRLLNEPNANITVICICCTAVIKPRGFFPDDGRPAAKGSRPVVRVSAVGRGRARRLLLAYGQNLTR